MKLKFLIFNLFFLAFFFAFLLPKVAFADTITLSGSVKNASGSGVIGATVTVNDATNDSTTTDTSGNYSLAIPQGTYDVQVTPSSGSNFSSAIALSQNISTDTTLNFILTPTGIVTLSGHVLDADGNPLESQRVMLQTSGGTQYVTTTDASGAYSLQAPAGTYAYLFVMNVTANSFSVSAPERYQAIVQNYDLSQSTIVDFTIPAKRVIVHVQDQATQPVGNVTLGTSNSGSNGLALGGGITANIVSKYGEGGDPSLTTDAQGDATMWLIPSQNYTFTATPTSGSGYVATSLSNVSITTNTTVTMTLPQTFTLSGHVYGPLGDPLGSQRVMLQTSGGTQYVTTTDASGAYSLQAPADTYAFLYVMNVNANSFSTNAPERYQAIAQNYTLSQNTTADFTIPAKRVTLHVKDALNNPISNASIQTSNSGSNGLTISTGITANITSSYGTSGDPSLTTDAQGDVTLWLIPSQNYTITATPPSGSGYVTASLSNQSISNDVSLTLTLPKPVVLSGHVYGPLGDPLESQRVMLQTSGGTQYVTMTDASGAYSLQAPIGTYAFLFVMNVNANSFSSNAPERYQAIAQNYTLSQDTTVDFTIPAKRVIVHVQNGANNPVENVAIQTSNSGSNGLTISTGITANVTSVYGTGGDPVPTTDAQGDLTLWLIPSQNYTITATPPQGSIYTTFELTNVQITSDQTEIISLQYNHATPTTTINLATDNGDGTYSDPTTVTLSASAAAGFSVANTYYTIDGGTQQTYTAPFTIAGAGDHTVSYYTIDNSGVQEASKSSTFTIQASHSITGTVYEDTNSNGIQDQGETGYANATVTLTGDASATATTDSNGNYSFPSLPQGNYTLTLTTPNEYVPTTQNPVSIPLTADTTVNYGIAPKTTILTPSKDTYIKSGNNNENEGASTFIRIRANGHNRGLITFDQQQIADAIGNSASYTATLNLTITDNSNNWGSSGRTIDLHRLTSDWAEGNGFISGNSPSDRGTGQGATWSCAIDSDISNHNDDCSGATAWNMGSSSNWPFVSTPTATANITNNQTGVVAMDVTTDIQAFLSGTANDGWIIKKTNEGANGLIEFGSKESASAPQLVITRN